MTRYGSIRPRQPSKNGLKSRPRPRARTCRTTGGAVRASATRAPISRIGYSQTSGKTTGATRATKALASAPPVETRR